MRAGLILIELMIALAVAAIILMIAAESLSAAADAAAVREEVATMVTAFDAARGAAIRLDADTRLTIADSGYIVEALDSVTPVVAWRDRGPVTRGVTITGAGAPIDFAPAGIAAGVANRTIVLSRGRAHHSVVISRLGRLTY